jgi:predicted alpha/beta-fold hydrolase
MRGIAAKAYRAGFNVIRMNQRTCGGTEHLTPTLYNSGLSQDYRAIVHELARVDGLDRIWLVGYSMGGNLVLKAAGEAGSSEAALAGAIAVCPNIDPKCVIFGTTSKLALSPSFLDPTQEAHATESGALSW